MLLSLRFALCATLLLASCGGGSKNPSFEELNASGPGNAGLPELGSLGAPERSLSITGPGWFRFNEHSVVDSGNATVEPFGTVELDSSGGLSFVVFCASGFDGDNAPTSARVEATNVTGTYWVAFSDFADNRWRFAGPFSSNATADIPGTGEYPNPDAFVSEFNATYVAIVMGPASTANVQVELGVHGGSEAPASLLLSYSAGPSKILLTWNPGLDELAPDFGGYTLQRKEVGGEWEQIFEGSDQFFIDDTVTPGTQYSYRLRAFDVSGNASSWTTIWPVATNPMGDIVPVPVIAMPEGPLQGPATITIDMTSSFDPEGAVIDSYSVNPGFFGPAPQTNTSGMFTMKLQPGCYSFTFTVQSGVFTGFTTRYVKVLPTWKPNPALVGGGTGQVPRLANIRSVTLSDGRLMHLGVDLSSSCLVVRPSDGVEFGFRPLPHYGMVVDFVSEIVPVGEKFAAVIGAEQTFIVLQFDHQGGEILGIIPRSVFGSHAALTVDGGGHLAVVYPNFDGVNYSIHYRPLGGPTEIVASGPLVFASRIDAIYTPGAGAIDILFGAGSIHACRFRPGLGSVMPILLDSGLGTASNIDVEINPETGTPGALYQLGDVLPTFGNTKFRLNVDDTTWQPAETIATMESVQTVNLVADATRLYALHGPAKSVLDSRASDGTWTKRNESPEFMSYYYGAGIVISSGGTAHVTMIDIFGSLTTMRFNPNGTAATLGTLPAGSGLGAELHCAGASDGLHVISRARQSLSLAHFRGSANGVTWAEQTGSLPVFSTDLDLASTSEGELYSSRITLGSAYLDYWDGSMWVNQQSVPATPGYRPDLMDQPTGSQMYWTAYDHAGTDLYYVRGNQTTPWISTAVTPPQPIWDMSVSGVFSGSMLAASGFSAELAALDYFGWGVSVPTDQAATSFTAFNSPDIRGRQMSSVLWSVPGSLRLGFYLANQSGPTAVRRDLSSDPLAARNFVWESFAETSELRHTASSATAGGLTAVGLLSDYLGDEIYLEWSNYGTWEDLPLPPALRPEVGTYVSCPHVFRGQDGRLHIVYCDLESSELRCVSTL